MKQFIFLISIILSFLSCRYKLETSASDKKTNSIPHGIGNILWIFTSEIYKNNSLADSSKVYYNNFKIGIKSGGNSYTMTFAPFSANIKDSSITFTDLIIGNDFMNYYHKDTITFETVCSYHIQNLPKNDSKNNCLAGKFIFVQDCIIPMDKIQSCKN